MENKCSNGGGATFIYVPRCQGTYVTAETCWSQLSHTFLTASFRHSRHHLQWLQLFTSRSSLAAHRLTFCAIWRIGARTRRLDHPSSVLLPQKVSLAFHVPAFQRNHSKRLAPFTLERSGSNSVVTLRSSLALTHYVSSPIARSKPHSWGGWSEVADATVQTD